MFESVLDYGRACYPWSRVRACSALCHGFNSDVDVQSTELAEIY